MHEEIIAYLLDHPEGTSSSVLAEIFLKIKNPPATFAHTAISSILSKDKRFFLDDTKRWHAKIKAVNQTQLLNNLPLTTVFILCDPQRKSHQIYYLALWNILPSPHFLMDIWLTKPNILNQSNDANPGSTPELSVEHSSIIAKRIGNELKSRVPIFLNGYEQNLLRYALSKEHYHLNEDTMLISEFFQAAELVIPQPLTLSNCTNLLFGINEFNNAFKMGEKFTDCIFELIQQLQFKGVTSREDIENSSIEKIKTLLAGKKFTHEDIASLPETHGVFGFKDKSENFIYIGRAINLKRKILNFFKEIEDSPQKLKNLLHDFLSISTYQCNNELESIIYEHRLNKKYSLPTSAKATATGNDFDNETIPNCLVMAAHLHKDKIVTFWVKRKQKILIKTLEKDFNDENKLTEELELFFYKDNIQSEVSDPDEMKSVFQWTEQNRGKIILINVGELESVTDLVDSIKGAIKDYSSE
jgi:hypothetical protein